MNINPNSASMLNLMDRSNIEKTSKDLKNADDERLREVCQDFESIFLNMMMKEMRKNVPDGGIVEKSQGSLIFEDMYMEELSNEISKSENGIGLAKEMYEQLKNNEKVVIR